MITPGGNPTCAMCDRWYGPGMKHVCEITGVSELDVEEFQMLAAALQQLDQVAETHGAYVEGDLFFTLMSSYATVEYDKEKRKHVVTHVYI